MERIEAMGGVLVAIEKGYVQREIEQAAYEFQQKVESKQQVVVGVNQFVQPATNPIPVLRIDPGIEKAQVDRLLRLRQKRNAARVEAALRCVEEAAGGSDNLLPLILEAVEAYATVGEISHALRRVFGEYKGAAVA